MGTWDTGPFDNDVAADFGGKLDALPQDQRAAAIREALSEAAECDDYLDEVIGTHAIAAAALVARELADGAHFVSPAYGPQQPLPPLPPELKALAIAAIDRTVAADSEIAEEWGDPLEETAWYQGTLKLRAALAPE
ncbi:hypothetical protein ABIA31_009068 [Catenulispora sp. MAP5-51]|uniref:DUF4259 domain-containing protein n=1 Tax=Catenulispora sp. MAP5-51 TaxID=3156298 RepID=UPI003519989B